MPPPWASARGSLCSGLQPRCFETLLEHSCLEGSLSSCPFPPALHTPAAWSGLCPLSGQIVFVTCRHTCVSSWPRAPGGPELHCPLLCAQCRAGFTHSRCCTCTRSPPPPRSGAAPMCCLLLTASACGKENGSQGQESSSPLSLDCVWLCGKRSRRGSWQDC